MFSSSVSNLVMSMIVALDPQAAPLPSTTTAVTPATASGLSQFAHPTFESAEECEGLVNSMSNFDVALAKRRAERLRLVGTTQHQLVGFANAVRSQAWFEALNTRGQQRDAALRILQVAGEALKELSHDTTMPADELDTLVAALDAAFGNACLIVQAIHSIQIETRISVASEVLEDARPWYWWNDTEGERTAGRIAASAQLDRNLADLRSGTLVDGFLGDACDGWDEAQRKGYLRVTGLDVAKPTHEGVIPDDRRVWDWRQNRIEAPVDAPRSAPTLGTQEVCR